MNFIYEKLTEEDKEFFKSFGFRDPLSSFSLAYTPSVWVADRKKEIYLVNLGGQGYKFDLEFPPTYYYLIWDRKLVKIEAYDKGSGDYKVGKNRIWMIQRIVAQETLEIDENLLLDTIKEAFIAYDKGTNKKLLSTEFYGIPKPIFVKGDIANG
ncbi:hypothetical protein [uncultured Clostridium sp.]|uniref:hypothetical protein n=1 Tax=uncultured Clostridium sp. TaxID=59620 RepID=UPI0025FAD0C9|nr:hypothetical protein [uncultured Clostridium sp.]